MTGKQRTALALVALLAGLWPGSGAWAGFGFLDPDWPVSRCLDTHPPERCACLRQGLQERLGPEAAAHYGIAAQIRQFRRANRRTLLGVPLFMKEPGLEHGVLALVRERTGRTWPQLERHYRAAHPVVQALKRQCRVSSSPPSP